MKKFLSHLTGIVFLIAILFTGGCGSKTSLADSVDCDYPPNKVFLEVKIHDVNGEKYLQLYESGKPETIAIDSLHVAEVCPGTKVIWKRAKDSGIKKFTKIGPIVPGEILPKDASKIPLSKRYRAIVPDIEIKPGTKEKYIIEFLSKDGETIKRDPYLRIPPPPD